MTASYSLYLIESSSWHQSVNKEHRTNHKREERPVGTLVEACFWFPSLVVGKMVMNRFHEWTQKKEASFCTLSGLLEARGWRSPGWEAWLSLLQGLYSSCKNIFWGFPFTPMKKTHLCFRMRKNKDCGETIFDLRKEPIDLGDVSAKPENLNRWAKRGFAEARGGPENSRAGAVWSWTSKSKLLYTDKARWFRTMGISAASRSRKPSQSTMTI